MSHENVLYNGLSLCHTGDTNCYEEEGMASFFNEGFVRAVMIPLQCALSLSSGHHPIIWKKTSHAVSDYKTAMKTSKTASPAIRELLRGEGWAPKIHCGTDEGLANPPWLVYQQLTGQMTASDFLQEQDGMIVQILQTDPHSGCKDE